MKKILFVLVCFVGFVGCGGSENSGSKTKTLEEYIKEKKEEKSMPLKTAHPLDKPYDNSADIFKEDEYSEKKLLEIIYEYGPLTFRKENDNWYFYNFRQQLFYRGNSFKLYRIPVDTVYDKKYTYREKLDKFFTLEVLSKVKSQYEINFRSSLNNILSTKKVFRNGFRCRLEKELKITDFNFSNPEYSDVVDYIFGEAIIYNTTNDNYKNIKIKIGIYSSSIDGELLTEDTFTIKDSFGSGDMKIIKNINYEPKRVFKKNNGVYGVDVEIIAYDKY